MPAGTHPPARPKRVGGERLARDHATPLVCPRRGAAAATTAVTDAYQALKQLVAGRFTGKPAAEVALAEHETDPDVWRAPLASQLTETGTAADPTVIEAAQRLLALLDADGSRAGKYTVDASGAQGVQIGDHNTQTNRFGPE